VRRLKGDLEGALGDFDHAISMKPYDSYIMNNRGVARRKKGDLEGALRDFSEAVRIKPDNANAVINCDGVRKALSDRSKTDHGG